MNDKDLPAIDAKLFKELHWCESLYYPMLDRIEVEKLKNISYHQRRIYYENDLRCMLWILENYKMSYDSASVSKSKLTYDVLDTYIDESGFSLRYKHCYDHLWAAGDNKYYECYYTKKQKRTFFFYQ